MTEAAAATKKLHDIDVDSYLYDCVQIEPVALESEFVRLPADIAYWNERHAAACRAFLAAKMHREQLEATLRPQVVEDMKREAEGAAAADPKVDPKKAKAPRAPTVADIDAWIKLNPEWQSARKVEGECEVERDRIYGVVNALRAKKDMLMQLGMDRRLELAGDPYLREQVRGERYRNDPVPG